MGFSQQGCWSGLPFPPAGDLPDPGIEPRFPEWKVDSLLTEPPGKPPYIYIYAVLSHSVMFDSENIRTVAHQGILQARILEWVAMPSPECSSTLGSYSDLGSFYTFTISASAYTHTHTHTHTWL